jgi:hypothetical protein
MIRDWKPWRDDDGVEYLVEPEGNGYARIVSVQHDYRPDIKTGLTRYERPPTRNIGELVRE